MPSKNLFKKIVKIYTHILPLPFETVLVEVFAGPFELILAAIALSL